MKRYIIIIFLLSVQILTYSQDRYYFSKLSLEDGLSQITVTSIYQDKKGFMWFGTRNGLNRYDGYNFEVYTNNPENNTSISNNHVFCITEDAEGNLWIGTNNGLNKLNTATNTFTRYLHNPQNSNTISGNMIASIYCDTKNRLWVGTSNGLNLYDREKDSFTNYNIDQLLNNNPINTIVGKDETLYLGTVTEGLILFNSDTKKYTTYKNQDGNPLSITSNDIRSVFIDNDESLWIGTHHNGINLLKKGATQFLHYNQKNGLTNDFIRCINQSPEGNILIGTFNGLNIIDPKSGKIDQYKTYDIQKGNLSHYSIYSIYFDKAHTLWIGTYAGGVNYSSPYGQKFRFHDPITELRTVLGIIGPIIETENSLFIASEGGGLLEMEKQSGTFKQYKLFDDRESVYVRNIVKFLYRDENRILCGTNLGTIYSFDLKTHKFSLIHDFKTGNSIYQIGRTMSGDLFVAGVNKIGLTLISQNGNIKNKFPTNENPNFSFYNVRCVLEIEKNVFLLGTRNDGLFYYDMNKKELTRYKSDLSDTRGKSLPENYISSIFKDSMGQIWIGTFGGGFCLFDPSTGTFRIFNKKNGLLDNNVCAIVEDNNRHLWISTISGISDFNIQNQEITNYTHSSGININEFTPHAGSRLADNRIVFSGNNGFVSFNPRKMYVNPYIPPLVLENLYINNNKINPGDNTKILSKQLNTQDQIELRYDESNIAIEYSALNYIFTNRNQYAYILEGFDKDWNYVGIRRIAYYTNIPPGEYRFLVKGSNNDGVWNNDPVSIKITILPPFWKTWWAYTIYTLLIVAVSALIFRYYNERKRLENDIKLKQAKADAQEEFHQARNKLFTNFSHELRTPLTLIMSPLGDMIEKGADLPERIQEKHRMMYSNTLRMLRLVNNLMDFQKKESGTMKLKTKVEDFIQFSEEMLSLFRELAESRNIALSFTHAPKNLELAFDKNLMEKVYFNFLSNAFKNVPDRGAIEVSINRLSLSDLKKDFSPRILFNDNSISYLILEIRDSGVGIPKDQLEDIFTPFHQVAQNKHSSSGTGLGLSLSKSIIEMHNGTVWAEVPETGGAIFRCIIPINEKENIESIDLESNNLVQTPQLHKVDTPHKQNTSDNLSVKKYTVLIVEDNEEVKHYITEHLSYSYNIITAANGDEGIEQAQNILPDLIITDLMMPKMDGMEMCSIIKRDIHTSHIPIIMLSARAMSSDIQEGYEYGADDYITKPFNTSLLLARVENLIKTRENLKEVYGKKFTPETLGIKVNSVDELFIQKLYKVLEENISNPEFNLDNFSKEAGMSRASLYRKIKAITDLSPNELLRNFRLEMGAKLLREAKIPVSEVYVSVGFNSIAYFSTCFKNHFGVTPSDYQSHKQ